jgi:transcriptional regulator with XRE-family HTH domain
MIAQNLRVIRESVRLSQRALAGRTGLGQQYLSRLELGLRPSHPDHVSRIADALGCEPRALLEPVAIGTDGRVYFLKDLAK